MRKTHIALLVAVVCSPLALAGDPNHTFPWEEPAAAPAEGVDVDASATESFNKKIDIDVHDLEKKEVLVKDSFNDDSDFMLLKDVNNKYKFKYEEAHKATLTETVDIDFDMDVFVAWSDLEGGVMGNRVNYNAGAELCCYAVPGTVEVYHGNYINGAFVDAHGINLAAQNAGNNSLIQQSASTNAALSE